MRTKNFHGGLHFQKKTRVRPEVKLRRTLPGTHQNKNPDEKKQERRESAISNFFQFYLPVLKITVKYIHQTPGIKMENTFICDNPTKQSGMPMIPNQTAYEDKKPCSTICFIQFVIRCSLFYIQYCLSDIHHSILSRVISKFWNHWTPSRETSPISYHCPCSFRRSV